MGLTNPRTLILLKAAFITKAHALTGKKERPFGYLRRTISSCARSKGIERLWTIL